MRGTILKKLIREWSDFQWKMKDHNQMVVVFFY